MTIEEMRRKMRSEVVPEEVIPQNVINCLIDEDAEPPKPDAFSFLTRLRALGIGSDDFINLLVGCGAPDDVVTRIKQNPAMNLQGLILTLENSELTSDDYTRMLLTARQVWERTLTLRLEKSEKVSREIEDDEDAPVKVYGDTADSPGEQAETAADQTADVEEDEDYDEDLREMSFTAVLDSINAETWDTPEDTDGKDGEQPAQDPSDETELSFAEAFDKIKSEKKLVPVSIEAPEKTERQESSGDTASGIYTEKKDGVIDTTTLVQIDEEMLRESFGKLSGSSGSDNDDGEKASEEPPKTAKQKSSETEENSAESGAAGEDENNTAIHYGYHRKAIIGSTIGAAVLVGTGFAVGHFIGGNEANSLHYAADNYEIFDKIYYAYDDDVSGGETVSEIGTDHRVIFGDLLIGSDDAASFPNSFSIGTGLYSMTEEAVSVSIVENGRVTPLDNLVPPKNSRFVAAFDSGSELYALFSGKQSGFMKISDGETLYTVYQDGVLTDYGFTDGEIWLGTVYTPSFGHTFTINDEEMYLPKLGAGTPQPISAKQVIVSETDGYSYGVSAGYSTENGSVSEVCAIIGDPMAASADGRFALNGENGLLVNTGDSKLTARETGKLVCVAFGENCCVTAEENEPENIKLLDGDFAAASVLTGVTEKISAMRFDSGFLTIISSGGIFSVDCSDIASPEPLRLKQVNGIVAGQTALTCESNGSSVQITRYDLKNGAAEKVGEYSRTLAAGQPETAKLADPKTALILDGSKCGVAYSYFDGVSVVSEYVVFANNEQPKTVSVYDDKTGFTAASENGGKVNAICAEGVKVLQ